jgi:hypothetical protein
VPAKLRYPPPLGEGGFESLKVWANGKTRVIASPEARGEDDTVGSGREVFLEGADLEAAVVEGDDAFNGGEGAVDGGVVGDF